MIKTFKHKGLKQFFIENNKMALDARDLGKITRILDRLDAAEVPQDMNIPGWNLHLLKGDRSDVWSVSVRKNWKITFKLEDAEVSEVNLEDYH
jgi:proteic killer suppression protein